MESTKKMKDQAETGHQSMETKPRTTEQNESSTLGNLSAKSGEIVGQAKDVASDVYNRASKSLNQGVNQAVDYSREHPGQATLIAFGAGLGVGLLLANTLMSPSRSRTSRIVPPVMNAISEIAAEIFRR